jgi:hypothetical protein
MNLVKEQDATTTEALWVELTDLDSELVCGGKKSGSKGGKSVIRIYIEDSTVLIAGGDIKFGDNAF